MKYDLENMSKEQLILLISKLDAELESFKDIKKSKAGVVIVGSPKIVRDYTETQKRLLAEQGDK